MEGNKTIDKTIRNLDQTAYTKARVAALKLGVTIGSWISEAIKQRLARESKRG